MTRVCKRPVALLDGAAEAARLVEPQTDAERYFDGGRVPEKMPAFLGYLALLGDRSLPRMMGYARIIEVERHPMVAIRGESGAPEGEEAMYGFAMGPDGGEFVEVRRVAGDQSRLLSWVDVRSPEGLVFRTPDLTGTIEDEPRVSELTQILAAGQDAAEWALD